MAGKIIADIIEAPYDKITLNVGNTTVLTANGTGITYVPTSNLNINIGSTANLTLGNVTATSVITNGIKFPATQVASGDANTLDDYEEGTYTPTVGGATTTGTTTYTNQNGSYTKIGRLITARGEVGYSAATGTGTMRISLPFATSFSATGSIMVDNLNWGGGTYLVAFSNSGEDSMRIFYMTDDAGWGAQQMTNEAVEMHFTITYMV